jgi:hypothetical protein
VLQEAAHELLATQSDGAPAVRCAMLVAQRHAGRIEGDDAVVRDGDAENVSGEIAQDGLVALISGGAVNDPALGARCRGQQHLAFGHQDAQT